jgi:hypothetical protein
MTGWKPVLQNTEARHTAGLRKIARARQQP